VSLVGMGLRPGSMTAGAAVGTPGTVLGGGRTAVEAR
jgi:hypothetical protein